MFPPKKLACKGLTCWIVFMIIKYVLIFCIISQSLFNRRRPNSLCSNPTCRLCYTVNTMPVVAWVTSGARASAGMVLTPRAGIFFCLQHQKSQVSLNPKHISIIFCCRASLFLSLERFDIFVIVSYYYWYYLSHIFNLGLSDNQVLTLKWLGHFFQNGISFSDAVHLNV